jgi:hypothetical protein
MANASNSGCVMAGPIVAVEDPYTTLRVYDQHGHLISPPLGAVYRPPRSTACLPCWVGAISGYSRAIAGDMSTRLGKKTYRLDQSAQMAVARRAGPPSGR